jgi:hypothetical protein
MGGHQIAQLNVARAVAPLDDSRMANFLNLLDEINRLADERPVAPGDLRSRVDGLAAARSEEHCSVLDGREVCHPARELERRLVRMVAEDVMGRECPQLRPDGVRDLDPAVTDVREPEARGGIEVLVPVDVPDAGAFPAREDELVPVDLAHRGERVPEAGARGRHRWQT